MSNYLEKTLNRQFQNERAPFDGQYESKASQHGKFAIVLKGTIQNIDSIKAKLEIYGYSLYQKSQEEIIANLIEWFVIYDSFSTKEALMRVIDLIEGSVAFVVYDENTPDKYYAYRKHIKLYIAQEEDKVFISTELSKLHDRSLKNIPLNEHVLTTFFDCGRVICQNVNTQSFQFGR